MLDRLPFITEDNNQTFYWFENGYLLFNKKKRQFCQVLEALPIKNIVFSGGGTRGILYAGVISAFEEFYPSTCIGQENFLSQIETISGASIGSVFAATLAAGIRSNELFASMSTVNFETLLGTGWGPIKRNADPLYSLLKEIIITTLKKRLKELAEDKELIHSADFLVIEDELKKTSPIITFGMLKTLQQIYPAIFKELYITVVCKENGAVCYFSAENTPELEIALACLASAAVPVIVEPVKIPKIYINSYANDPTLPDIISFVDGGLLDNVPFSIVENKQKKTYGINKGEFNQNLQTLIIFFDDSIAAEHHLSESVKKPLHYSQSPFLNARSFSKHELAPRTKLDFIYDMAPKVIGRINMNANYSAQREKIYEQIRLVYSQRNIPLAAGFTSADFAMAIQYQRAGIERSKDLTLDYLNNHQNECIYQTYQQVDKLIKQLPLEWFLLLLQHIEHIAWLRHYSPDELKNIRENSCNIKNHFNCYFEQIYAYQAYAQTFLYKELLNHFLLIRNDHQANHAAKMIRALAVTLDYYPRLMKAKEHDKILFLLNSKFRKYFKIKKNKNEKTNQAADIINMDFNAVHFCLDKNARLHFNNAHLFYGKLQRIIFVLKRTNSTFINPEDPFKRKFLKTIINELCDIAAFHLSEKEKLKKMEDYLIESYYKIIFYQKRPDGVLAQTLKNIIESRAGLNLPYKYGIYLPKKIEKLPKFNELLKKNYKIKKIIFISKFFQIDLKYSILSIPREFESIKKIFFPLNLLIENIKKFDEIIMQAMVTAFLFAPDYKNRQYASNLYHFIVPSELNNNKNSYQTIFDVISLMSHLSWTKPLLSEKEIHENIIIDLKCIVLDYVSEQHSRDKLHILVKKYTEDLMKLESPNLFGFFKQTSEILQLIQSFKRQVLFESDQSLTLIPVI